MGGCVGMYGESVAAAHRKSGRGKGSRYSLPFKRYAVWRYLFNGEKPTPLCRQIGIIGHTNLYRWAAQYKRGKLGPQDLKINRPEEPTPEEDQGRHLSQLAEERAAKAKQAAKQRNIEKNGYPLLDFCRDVLGYEAFSEKTHDKFFDIIERGIEEWDQNRQHNEREKDPAKHIKYQVRKLVHMPRGSFKTTGGVIGAALYILAEKNPNARILLSSETGDLSIESLSSIKSHIQDNETFIEKYGKWKPHKDQALNRWTSKKIDVSVRTDYHTKEPSVACSGIDMAVNGKHFDVMILDDLHSILNVNTQAQIDKVIDYYKYMLSVLNPDGLLIVVGTPYRVDDLYAHITDRMKHSKACRWEYLWAEAHDDDWNLNFPQILTKDFLEDQLEEQGSFIYSCMYRCRPIDMDTNPFREEWLQYYNPRNPLDHPDWNDLNWAFALDPASSDTKNSDSSAGWLGALDPANELWIVDGLKLQTYSLDEIVKTVLKMCEPAFKYGLRRIGVEEAALSAYVQSAFNREIKMIRQQRRDFPNLLVEPLKHRNRNKGSRILGLEPVARRRGLHLPANMPKRVHMNGKERNMDLIHVFRGQWTRFSPAMTTKEKDDELDSMAYLLEMLKAPPSSSSIVERLRRGANPLQARRQYLMSNSRFQRWKPPGRSPYSMRMG